MIQLPQDGLDEHVTRILQHGQNNIVGILNGRLEFHLSEFICGST